MTKFGGVSEDALLATFDARSLEQCFLLGFACLDGRPLIRDLLGVGRNGSSGLADSSLDQSHPGYNKLMWAKPLYVEALLRLGYPVIYSDLDTVWVKKATTSMALALDSSGADAVMMEDLHDG